MSAPKFLQIKQHIVSKVEGGRWLPGDPVPSENQLAEQFSVSRMTARRALTELTEAGVLARSQGAGTFVADQLPTGSLLEIRNIADEIRQRGHEHSAQVMALETRLVDESQLPQLGFSGEVFFSRVLHCENDQPLQLEERYVNPALVPEYLAQDFTLQTPNAYLNEVCPLSEADHWVEAVLLSGQKAKWLAMDKTQPCLKVTRRTFGRVKPTNKRTNKSKTGVVSFALLYHPGSRYRLGGHLQV